MLSTETLLELIKAVANNGPANTNAAPSTNAAHPYEIGKLYHVRTVTMAIAGKLKAVYDNELVFEDASWVASSGRFNEYLKDCNRVDENEPFNHDVIVGRGAIIDCTEMDAIYTKVK